MLFDVTTQEAHAILNSLGAQPFNLVAELIGKLQRQAQEQLNKTPTQSVEANEVKE